MENNKVLPGFWKRVIWISILLAVGWRVLTLVSYFNVGIIGIELSDEREITNVYPNTAADRSGLQAGDRIVDVEGLYNNTDRLHIGKTVTYIIDRAGENLRITVEATDYPLEIVLVNLFTGLAGLVFLFCGYRAIRKTGSLVAVVFGLFCLTMAIRLGGFPQAITNEIQNLYLNFYLLIIMASGSFLVHFILMFGFKDWLQNKRWISFVIYAPTVAGLFFFVASITLNEVWSGAVGVFYSVEVVVVNIMVGLVFLVMLIGILLPESKSPSKNNFKIMLPVTFVSVVLVTAAFTIPAMRLPGYITNDLYALILVVIPIIYTIEIIKASRKEVVASAPA